MKRALVVLLLFATTAAAGDREACVARRGTWANERGAEGCRVKGAREGLWAMRFPGGQIREREGTWTEWGESGAKLDEGPYRRGKREGVWTFYDKREGQKQLEGPFVDDRAEGKFTEWSADGTKWREIEMKNGERVGPGPATASAAARDLSTRP